MDLPDSELRQGFFASAGQGSEGSMFASNPEGLFTTERPSLESLFATDPFAGDVDPLTEPNSGSIGPGKLLGSEFIPRRRQEPDRVANYRRVDEVDESFAENKRVVAAESVRQDQLLALQEATETPWEGEAETEADRIVTYPWGMKMSIASMLAIVGLVLVSVVGSLGVQSIDSADAWEDAALKDRQQLAAVEAENQRRASARQNDRDLMGQAHDIANKLTGSESWEEMVPFVRNPDAMKPLMAEHYSHQPFRGFDLKTLGGGAIMNLPATVGDGIDRVIVLKGSYSDFTEAAIPFAVTEGGPVLDWESLVGYNPINLATLKQDRPVGSHLVRVRVSERNYFADAFPDQDKFVCVDLHHPDEPGTTIYGYCERSGGLGIQLREMLEKSATGSEPLILKVSYDGFDSGAGLQIWIEAIDQRGWIR